MSQQTEVINKIKSKEEEAKGVINSAEQKGAAIISDASFKAKDIIRKAQILSEEEIKVMERDSLQRTRQEAERITRDTQAELKRIESLSDRNMDKARDYIIKEFLKLWQLQR